MVERFQLAKAYTISRVINGLWKLSEGHSLHNPLDNADILRAFYELVESGFTTFDCADIYTGAEESLGKFVAELKKNSSYRPEDIQIHTKYVPDISLLSQLDFDYTEKIIDRSLARLNREVLDLVQFHWWDYEVPGCVETAGHLQRLKEKGKIRNVAVTNFDAQHLAEMVDAGIEIISCQTQYSVLDRRPEKSLLAYCKQNGISQLCYGTIAGGLLAEKWIGEFFPNDPDNRSQVKYIQVIEESMGWDAYQELLRLLDQIAKKHSVQIAHVATKYVLGQAGVAATIIGTRSSRHVASNARIFSFELADEDIKAIRALIETTPILDGEPFELERTVG